MITKIIRWTARIGGGAYSVFWMIMFFTNCLVSTETAHTGRYIGFDKFQLTLMWISMIGLLYAWKNELAGGLFVLIPSLILLAIRPNMIQSGQMLIPAFGFLFLYCYWKEKSSPVVS